MLRYFANGAIRWKKPMRCNTRTNWEFYAVIEGRCAATLRDREKPVFKEKTLWVFSPECSHAWHDDRHRKYHRIAFHFGSVPYPLDEIVRQNGGWLERKLSDDDIARLQAFATAVEPHYLQPNQLSTLHFEGRLMDLSLLTLEGSTAAQLSPLPDLANFKVESALSWYAEHLIRKPSVKEIADAVHVSTSHLRRLFWQVRHTSPKTALQRVRLDRAQELMSRTAMTLEDVARHCGFNSSSHFCREYRAFHNFTPTHWRKKLIDRFNKPFPPGEIPTRDHSPRPHERLMPA
ncbi:helix-turn-helix domain-containing protein [Oleiharenicola lentus]|uniref:helix-turn-helix domain-containing protein n=1 Tax=Oleiharenicola lentus TaxID=2508720 RepID=UPI003F677792